MELNEFIKERLNVSEEDANKITECFKEYKKLYGHGHHHEHDNNQNVNEMVCEDLTDKNYDLENIHCNGCHNNCALSEPKCGRGEHIRENLSSR